MTIRLEIDYTITRLKLECSVNQTKEKFPNFTAMRFWLISMLCLMTLALSGQNQVFLKTGSIHMSESLTGTRSAGLPVFNKRKYAIVRFGDLLLTGQQDELSAQGVRFIASVDGAYYLSYPSDLRLDKLAIRPASYGIFPGALKLSTRLLDETSSDAHVTIRLLHTGEHDFRLLESAIKNAGGEIIDLKMQIYNIVTVDISADKVIELAEVAPVMWIEHIPEAEEALRYQAVRDERVNMLHSDQYGLTGAGMTVGVGDAGKVGDHIDLNGHLTNYATYSVHSHATHVSGIIAGKDRKSVV